MLNVYYPPIKLVVNGGKTLVLVDITQVDGIKIETWNNVKIEA